MNIFVITPIYVSANNRDAATPIVHYYTKEWVKMGHFVKVYQLEARFPRLYYFIGKHFQHQLNNKLNIAVPTECPRPNHEIIDGVDINRNILRKLLPHSLYNKKQLNSAVKIISSGCEQYGIPDIFIAHWDNPCLEVFLKLKEQFNRPICLVFHSSAEAMLKRYGRNFYDMLSRIDIVGFRNISMKKNFENYFGHLDKSFIAYSGVSQHFLESYEGNRSFADVKKFVYVGSLIERKYPEKVYTALARSFDDGSFKMTYIGDGQGKKTVYVEYQRYNYKGNVLFTGRISREKIIKHLKEADVFVMISRNEVFGLVYLEAMALGCITIAAREEGFDGIIIDGLNGFLCEAGNEVELLSIINKIRQMSNDELICISNNAVKTANDFSDSSVAKKYLESIQKLL